MMDSQPDHDCIMITCDYSPRGAPRGGLRLARSPPRAPTRVVLPALESVERKPQRGRVDPRGPRPRHGVQGRSGQQLSSRRARARAARSMRMQHRRVASWPGGLDGLSPKHHAPIPCQSVPGRRRVLSAIALCSRPGQGSLTYPMVRTSPRGSANPTGIQMTDPPVSV